MQILLRTSLLAVTFLASLGVAQAQAVAFVSDIEGQWLLNNSQPVRVGQQLPGGGVVTNQSGREQDYIALANLRGESLPGFARSCKVAGECSRPINLPRVRKAGVLGMMSALVEGAMALMFDDHGNVIIIPRGRGVSSLPEGVVALDGEQLDLSSIFRGRDPDHFLLGFIPRGDAPAEKGLGPIKLEWNPKLPARVAVPGITPGLYELNLMKAVDDRYVRTDDNTWILVIDQRNYRTLNQDFQQASALTEKWDRRVSPEAKHSFLRASLRYLANHKLK